MNDIKTKEIISGNGVSSVLAQRRIVIITVRLVDSLPTEEGSGKTGDILPFAALS